MYPNPPIARKKLKYPLYGADFDPLNQDFLIVGGGGGSSSTGVPNQISLLDVSRFKELNEIVDIELARDEDSVTSLAIADSSETSLIAYAGINGSVKDIERGRNEHFRSFKIGLPARKRKADGQEKTEVASASSRPLSTEALSRTAIFRSATGPKNEAYQRVLRVSPQLDNAGSRIAAIATGMAPQNEIVTLRTSPSPSQSNVISRIAIDQGEANDLDITVTDRETKSFMLAYCTDHDVYLQSIPAKGNEVKEPTKVHTISKKAQGSKIRAIRWLTPRYMVLIRNLPGRTGADLCVLKTDNEYTAAQLILVKRVAKSTKQVVGLDSCTLSKSPLGDQQFLIAVAGQDSSLEIFTIDYHPGSGMDKFKQYTYLVNLHAGPITRVTFSRFKSPALPVTKDTKPQYIRLATVGVDQTVSVITFPLRPYPTTNTNPRYVLTSPPETIQNAVNISIALLVVALTAFLMQVFCELRGAVPPFLGASNWLSPTWQERIARPYDYANIPVIPESMPPVVETATSSLSSAVEAATDTVQEVVQSAVDAATESGNSLLHHLVSAPETSNKAIIIRDSADGSSELTTEIRDHDSDPVKAETLKKWDELTEKQKKGWKRKLIDAGHWTEKQGETILKGILFSELGGLVNAAIRG